jgi:cytochrome c oxidase assembly factor CtaG
LAYAAGVHWNRIRGRRPVRLWQIVAFVAGLVALAAALSGPVDALADASFVAHMGQHIVLLMLAPPLLLLGDPLRLALSASPRRVARRLARILRSTLVHWLTAPLVAWLVFVAAIWTVHLSPLYEAALQNEAVHAGEHGLLLGAALLFWYPLVGMGPTLHPFGHLARLLYLLLATPQNAFLGLAIYQARHVLYAHYLVTPNPFHVSALADQEAAGELMWIAGSLVMFVALLLVAADWARNDARLAVRVDARLEGVSP